MAAGVRVEASTTHKSIRLKVELSSEGMTV
jgi:hypothetical protein